MRMYVSLLAFHARDLHMFTYRAHEVAHVRDAPRKNNLLLVWDRTAILFLQQDRHHEQSTLYGIYIVFCQLFSLEIFIYRLHLNTLYCFNSRPLFSVGLMFATRNGFSFVFIFLLMIL